MCRNCKNNCKWCFQQTCNVNSCYCCSMSLTCFISLVFFWIWLNYENKLYYS